MSFELLLFAIPVLIFSIIVHEVAHGYAALMLGDRTAQHAGRLTLNPLPHIDPVGSIMLPALTAMTGFFFGYAKPVPYNPNNLDNKKWGEAIVAFAGPLSNIVIAVIFAALAFFGIFDGLGSAVQSGVYFIVAANLFLALLNLIPVAPLDGSKILFALLPYKYIGIRRWMEKNQLILIGLVLVFLILTPILPSVVFGLTNFLL